MASTRNKLAGTTTGKSKSALFFKNNPESRAKKSAYMKKYAATPERRKYRAQLVKARRDLGIYGKGGKDVGHVTKTKTKLQSAASNRGDKKKFLFGKKSKS
jgi:hypothetical protein